MRIAHHLIMDPAVAMSTEPYTLAPGSTDRHAEELAILFGGHGNTVLRIERTVIAAISTPSTAVGRAPFSDFLKEARS